jgi:hypothetical protein
VRLKRGAALAQPAGQSCRAAVKLCTTSRRRMGEWRYSPTVVDLGI